jgi:hypothetical protein
MKALYIGIRYIVKQYIAGRCTNHGVPGSALRGVPPLIECGEGRLGQLGGLEDVAVDALVECSERSRMLDVVKGRLQPDSDEAGDDKGGELHLGIGRVRADA